MQTQIQRLMQKQTQTQTQTETQMHRHKHRQKHRRKHRCKLKCKHRRKHRHKHRCKRRHKHKHRRNCKCRTEMSETFCIMIVFYCRKFLANNLYIEEFPQAHSRASGAKHRRLIVIMKEKIKVRLMLYRKFSAVRPMSRSILFPLCATYTIHE